MSKPYLTITEAKRDKSLTPKISGLICAVFLVGCASTPPKSMTARDLAPATQADAAGIRRDVEPIEAPLTLEEAMARALKYNLDRRAKLLEESLALSQLDATKFDLLPKLIAQAGYSWRNNDRISNSRDPATGTAVPNRFISSDREHTTNELGLTWSLLDVGMSYYGSQQ